MTNNHIELCGAETLIATKLRELNIAVRDGTMQEVRDKLAEIEVEAREAGYVAEWLL
jgi:hypothetical protein